MIKWLIKTDAREERVNKAIEFLKKGDFSNCVRHKTNGQLESPEIPPVILTYTDLEIKAVDDITLLTTTTAANSLIIRHIFRGWYYVCVCLDDGTIFNLGTLNGSDQTRNDFVDYIKSNNEGSVDDILL